MKFLLSVILFLISYCGTYSQFEKLTHYNIFNNVLKVEFLKDGTFLLYGTAGGVLKSSDSGKSWDQKFSGTHNDILSVKELGSTLYGITNEGEFITSNDGGDKWEIKKISNQNLSDFYIDENEFYITQITDSIMYSSDKGHTWQSKFVVSDTLRAIYSKQNNIIVNRNYKQLLIYKENEWQNLDLPSFNNGIKVVNIRNNNKNLYFIYGNNVAILNNDFGWNEFNINSNNITEVLETDSHLVCFAFNSFTKEQSVIYYNKLKNSIDSIDIINDNSLHELSKKVNFANIDDEGNLVATGFGKTIYRKSIENKEWETVYSFMLPVVDALNWIHIYDKDTWRFLTFDGNFLKTENGGNRLIQGEHYTIDTISETQIRKGRIDKVRYVTNDSIIVNLSNSELNRALSTDGGMTFNKYQVDGVLTNASYINSFEDFELFFQNYYLKDYYTIFYKKSKDGNIDTLFQIDSVNIIEIKEYQSKLLLISEVDSTGIFEFYLTDTSYNNPEIVYSLEYENYDTEKYFISNIINVFIVNDNDIYLFADKHLKSNLDSYKSVFKITNFEQEAEILLNNEPVFFYFHDYNLGEDKLITIGIPDYENRNIEYFYGKISLENGFVYDLLSELIEVPFLSVHHAQNDNSYYFYSKQGHFWKPIEDDRIPTSVDDFLLPPPVWSLPPYPNPATNSTKIHFYTNSIQNINSLEINIYEISSGKRVFTNDFSITKSNNWSGVVEINTVDFSNGAYIVELSIGDIVSTQKLVIAK